MSIAISTAAGAAIPKLYPWTALLVPSRSKLEILRSLDLEKVAHNSIGAVPTDTMVSGEGGYKLETHGGRVPIPWIIGTAGWAIFFHQPFGTFDFKGPQSKFAPTSPEAAFPLDIFFVASSDPATIMAEYASLTGHPQLPPLWSLGYQQSHRTLASGDEVLAEAKTFRDKKLPCDALIYLGTGFCPSGWNTENGSFFGTQSITQTSKDHRRTPQRQLSRCSARTSSSLTSYEGGPAATAETWKAIKMKTIARSMACQMKYLNTHNCTAAYCICRNGLCSPLLCPEHAQG